MASVLRLVGSSLLLARVLLCAGGLMGGAAAAGAQELLAERLPGVCETATTESPASLQRRKQGLEAEIVSQTRTVRGLQQDGAAKKGEEARVEALQKTLRQSQEKLLEVVFQIECLPPPAGRTVEAPNLGTSRSIAKPTSNNVIEVTTYYATNRKATGAPEPVKFYAAGVDSKFHYGRAVVTIPMLHTPGAVEKPSLWKLEREPDPNKHFVLKSVTPLQTDAARKELADKLKDSRSKTLFVFVHGYNTSFTEAAMRTAQMTHDLKFPGLAFFYSWPSAAQIRSYWQDEETARLSEVIFEQLLDELAQLPVDGIYLVAHSMGSRIVGHALQSRVDKGKETKKLRELLLAAPDINAEIFRNIIAPKLSAMRDTRTTIYASSSDMALKASNVVHGFRRVGETEGGVFTFPQLETVDASGATSVTKGYGHLYVVDNSTVIKDMQTLILRNVPAKLRGLKEVVATPAPYWRLLDGANAAPARR